MHAQLHIDKILEDTAINVTYHVSFFSVLQRDIFGFCEAFIGAEVLESCSNEAVLQCYAWKMMNNNDPGEQGSRLKVPVFFWHPNQCSLFSDIASIHLLKDLGGCWARA